MNKGNASSVGSDYGRDLGEHFCGYDATVASHASYSAAYDCRLDVLEGTPWTQTVKRISPSR